MSYEQYPIKLKNKEFFNQEGFNKNLGLLYAEHFNEFPQICYDHIIVEVEAALNYFLEDEEWRVASIDTSFMEVEKELYNKDRSELDFHDKEQLLKHYSETLIFFHDNIGFAELMGTQQIRKILEQDEEEDDEEGEEEGGNSCILNLTFKNNEKGLDALNHIFKNLLIYEELEDKARVNIITQRQTGFHLHEFPIDYHDIDFDLYYNDEFKEFHEGLMEKISDSKSEQSFYILHGIPGTGKTSYLRYLMANTKRTVIYLPPYMVNSLSDPGFIDFLADHPNSILVIEDAEQVVQQEGSGDRDSGTTNLLNLTDGILGNCFKMDVICTFNEKLHKIDHALKRLGRLDDIFELQELEEHKAKKLCEEMDIELPPEGSRTLGDILNFEEASPRVKRAFEQESGMGFNQSKDKK